jgi:hypothetical protein
MEKNVRSWWPQYAKILRVGLDESLQNPDEVKPWLEKLVGTN